MLVCFELRTPRFHDLKSQSKVRSNKSEQTDQLNISKYLGYDGIIFEIVILIFMNLLPILYLLIMKIYYLV